MVLLQQLFFRDYCVISVLWVLGTNFHSLKHSFFDGEMGNEWVLFEKSLYQQICVICEFETLSLLQVEGRAATLWGHVPIGGPTARTAISSPGKWGQHWSPPTQGFVRMKSTCMHLAIPCLACRRSLKVWSLLLFTLSPPIFMSMTKLNRTVQGQGASQLCSPLHCWQVADKCGKVLNIYCITKCKKSLWSQMVNRSFYHYFSPCYIV